MTPQLELFEPRFVLVRFKRATIADHEFTAVETYLRSSQYPKGMTKGEKANFRRKCKNNFKFETGMLYFKNYGIDEASQWKICVRSDNEKRQILESCHSGIEGMYV